MAEVAEEGAKATKNRLLPGSCVSAHSRELYEVVASLVGVIVLAKHDRSCIAFALDLCHGIAVTAEPGFRQEQYKGYFRTR